MYVDSCTVRRNGKAYTRHLLRSSFRQGGKVKHKTLANLSAASDQEISAIKLALKHKNDLSALGCTQDVSAVLGKRIGAVWALHVLSRRLGIEKALGTSRQGKLALLQVIARTLEQGSRLSAVRLAQRHAVCEVLDIARLDEEDLYQNLGWLCEHQESIEKKLFSLRFPDAKPTLFLYDVTSSYLEGTCNDLADWGYNRDGKKSKMQIVVGLLTGPDGLPVAVRVFQGNTSDPKTVAEQVRTLADNFGVTEVTLVGDRGMLRGPQIQALPDGFRYITAISKPQIRTMLTKGVLQYELFSNELCEVSCEQVRYVLRRNPMRAEQMAASRQSKLASVMSFAAQRSQYLRDHRRASATKALRQVSAKIKQLKLDRFVVATAAERELSVQLDEAQRADVALLDGCYVIQSDLDKSAASVQELHERYGDLQKVERCFRTMKTAHLQMRPVFVHTETSTRAHAFVVMLALLLQRELEAYWRDLDITVQEGIDELGAIHVQQIHVGDTPIHNIPLPTPIAQQCLEQADILLPRALPMHNAHVHTKKSLASERKPT